MKLNGRLEELEERVNPRRKVWLTLLNDEDENDAIERYEHRTGVRLDPETVRWIRIEIHDPD
jgi:hypothetical protein